MLSGFVMEFSYGVRLRNGYSRFGYILLRVIRLYPLILLGALLGLIRAMGYGFVETGDLALGTYLPQFFMTIAMIPNVLTDGTARANLFPLDSPLWSLHFEIIAYLLFAVVFYGCRNRVLGVIAIVSVVGVALWLHQDFGEVENEPTVGIDYSGYLWGLSRMGFAFTAGILLFRFMRVRKAGRSLPIVLTTIFIVCLSFPRPVMPPIAALFIVVAIFPLIIGFGAGIELSAKYARFAAFLGALSYPVYVLHVPIIRTLSNTFKLLGISIGPEYIWNGLIILPATVLASCMALVLYDAPVRNTLKRWVMQGAGVRSSS